VRNTVVEAARFLAARSAEPITLGDVADHVGYSPFHLARSFERQLGMPPGQFLAAHRFQCAKRLLLASDLRIIDVCHAVGFTSVGTFTTRFTAAVGHTPLEFRRLPDLLEHAPPRAVLLPGDAPGGGVVTGSVRLSPAALAELSPHGGVPSIYVGVFPRRAARGTPVSGTLLGEYGDFVLVDVPPGTYWVLGTALPASSDPQAQLVPRHTVSGTAKEPVRVSKADPVHHRDLDLDLRADWAAPVVVALPPLASPDTERAVALTGY
jgi:AraC-like DNA-binding protein